MSDDPHLDFLGHADLIARVCGVPERTLAIRFDQIKSLNVRADRELRLLVVAIGSLMVERLATADHVLSAQAAIWWGSEYMGMKVETESEGQPWRQN